MVFMVGFRYGSLGKALPWPCLKLLVCAGSWRLLPGWLCGLRSTLPIQRHCAVACAVPCHAQPRTVTAAIGEAAVRDVVSGVAILVERRARRVLAHVVSPGSQFPHSTSSPMSHMQHLSVAQCGQLLKPCGSVGLLCLRSAAVAPQPWHSSSVSL